MKTFYVSGEEVLPECWGAAMEWEAAWISFAIGKGPDPGAAPEPAQVLSRVAKRPRAGE